MWRGAATQSRVELSRLLLLYSYLGFEAKRLIGEPCIRGADGEEFAPGRRGLTIYGGPGPRTMPEDIEDQPDAWADDEVFPIARQAEPKAPKNNSLSLPWKEDPLCFHRHWSSQRHCSRRAAQPRVPPTVTSLSSTPAAQFFPQETKMRGIAGNQIRGSNLTPNASKCSFAG